MKKIKTNDENVSIFIQLLSQRLFARNLKFRVLLSDEPADGMQKVTEKVGGSGV